MGFFDSVKSFASKQLQQHQGKLISFANKQLNSGLNHAIANVTTGRVGDSKFKSFLRKQVADNRKQILTASHDTLNKGLNKGITKVKGKLGSSGAGRKRGGGKRKGRK